MRHSTNKNRYLLLASSSVKEALQQLEALASDAVLLLVDEQGRLQSALTDGDIRRGLIRGLSLSDHLLEFTRSDTKAFVQGQFDLEQMRTYRERGYGIVPVVDGNRRVVDVINFNRQRSYLPLDAVIMAGGRGSRLRPLTDAVPKPLLPVGGEPIIAHNVNRLVDFGITNIIISINYLGEQLVDYFGDGSAKNVAISYVTEDEPRGTIGALSEVSKFENDYVLVMNSDLLTTINLEEMLEECFQKKADMVVATVPYEVKVPYGVVKTEGELVVDLLEKPTYTYYSSAGIYILKKEHLAKIPSTGVYDAPDLMRELYTQGHRVAHFPIVDYWLDIGKHEDYERAQRDIKRLRL